MKNSAGPKSLGIIVARKAKSNATSDNAQETSMIADRIRPGLGLKHAIPQQIQKVINITYLVLNRLGIKS